MNDSRTIWCGNLSDQVTEELLYELFLQVAPLERVRIPTDKDGRKMNFGFITFKHEISVDYALQLLNGTRLFDKSLNIKYRNNRNANDNSRNELHNPRNDLYIPRTDLHLSQRGLHIQHDLRHMQLPNVDIPNHHSINDPRQRQWNNRYSEHDQHRERATYSRTDYDIRNDSAHKRHYGDLRRELNHRRKRNHWN